MADVNVLVVFYSRYGGAERLALSAGVGAIQAEANIRLRRVADLAPPAVIEADAAWTSALARMNRDYVAPRPADPVWADVIVLVTPADAAREVGGYVASLPAIGDMAGKVAAPIAAPLDAGEVPAALSALWAAAALAGLIVLPLPPAAPAEDAVTRARLFGQRATRVARALKAG